VLGIFEPVEEFTGRCIAVVQRLDGDDDKLIVVPEGRQYNDDQIQDSRRILCLAPSPPPPFRWMSHPPLPSSDWRAPTG
jgi:hypothetical protein